MEQARKRFLSPFGTFEQEGVVNRCIVHDQNAGAVFWESLLRTNLLNSLVDLSEKIDECLSALNFLRCMVMENTFVLVECTTWVTLRRNPLPNDLHHQEVSIRHGHRACSHGSFLPCCGDKNLLSLFTLTVGSTNSRGIQQRSLKARHCIANQCQTCATN